MSSELFSVLTLLLGGGVGWKALETVARWWRGRMAAEQKAQTEREAEKARNAMTEEAYWVLRHTVARTGCAESGLPPVPDHLKET